MFQILGILIAARPAPRPTRCLGEDARLNTIPGPPFEEQHSEYVTLGMGNDHFHIAYSARNGPNCEPDITGNNVLIAVFELMDGRALIFGSGYGDRTHETLCFGARYGSDVDADLVDEILRGCLRLGDAKLVFAVPHGHVDHVNPEFVHALETRGHTFDELWVHVGDESEVRDMPAEPEAWDADEQNRICAFGSLASSCETQASDPDTISFATTVGTAFFSRREGHTPGAVDLVLQHVSGNYILLGSAPPGAAGATNCDNALYNQAIQVWNPHGNLVYQ